MKERKPTSFDNYLSFSSKVVIFLFGPNVLTRSVTEGIIDRKEEIKNSKLGNSVIKIAEQKAELIKKGFLKDATRSQVGEIHSISSMTFQLRRFSQEGYEKTLDTIRNFSAKSSSYANNTTLVSKEIK